MILFELNRNSGLFSGAAFTLNAVALVHSNGCIPVERHSSCLERQPVATKLTVATMAQVFRYEDRECRIVCYARLGGRRLDGGCRGYFLSIKVR